jgi:hypothetical protein
MVGSSYKCLSLISEARRLYDRGEYPECLRLIDSIRNCTADCGESDACSAALRLVSRSMERDEPSSSLAS